MRGHFRTLSEQQFRIETWTLRTFLLKVVRCSPFDQAEDRPGFFFRLIQSTAPSVGILFNRAHRTSQCYPVVFDQRIGYWLKIARNNAI